MTARARFPRTAVAAALKKLGADPFEELVKLARTTQDESIAMRIWMGLSQYVAPRMRSVEVTEKGSPPQGDDVKRAKQEVFGFDE